MGDLAVERPGVRNDEGDVLVTFDQLLHVSHA